MNDLGQAAVSADKAPRTERGRRTVRKLLEAAAQEFGQRGFHEAAITGITSRAGVALGTFYTYFESKEELFRALVREPGIIDGDYHIHWLEHYLASGDDKTRQT